MSRALMVLACIALLGACDGDGGDGIGGSCELAGSCGGDVEGVWTFQEICFDDIEGLASMGLDEPECRDAIKNADMAISGSMRFEGGIATIDAETSTDIHAVLTLACLRALSGEQNLDLALVCPALQDEYQTGGNFSDATCRQVGQACDCMLLREAEIASTQAYTVTGDRLMFQGDPGPTDYCVTGDTLRIGNTMGGDTEGAMTLTR